RRHTRLQGDWSSDVCSSDLTYLDQAHYYLMVRQQANAIASFQSAANVLVAARALNPYNADHPMNLARMFAGWAGIDPSKWPLARSEERRVGKEGRSRWAREH